MRSKGLDRYWIALGLFLALLAGEGIIGLIEPFFPPVSRWPSIETDLKSRQLSELGDSISLVFLGSSSTEAAVDSALLSELTGYQVPYNAAVPFSSPISHEPWLSDVIFRESTPALVLIGLPIWPQRGARYLPLAKGIASAAKPIEEGILHWSALAANRGVFADLDRLRFRVLARESGLWTDLGHQTVYYDRSPGTIEGILPEYGRPVMGDSQVEALRRIVTHVRTLGSDVVLFIEPGRYAGDVAESTIAEYISWLKQLSESLNVILWDTYSVDWDKALFTDEAHFNRDGTVAYTRYMAELLIGRVQDG